MIKDSKNFKEVTNCQLKDKCAALKRNQTYVLVNLLPGHKIGVQWVYTTKLNNNNSIQHYKARLVAQGNRQEYGVDYEETFTPVAKMTSIQVVLAIAAHEGWRVEQLDVNSAYLNGIIDTEIYMWQPPGFIDHNFPTRVCKLLKSLYSLKQAGRIWYVTASDYLTQIGFVHLTADPCIYLRRTEEGIVVICLYVNDYVYAGSKLAVSRFRGEMCKRFDIKKLGKAKFVVGIQIAHTTTGILITQSLYTH